MTATIQSRIQSFAFVISTWVCALFSVCFVFLSPSGWRQSYTIELEEKINPNYAVAASLVRLPGIGLTRAEAIIAYRENLAKQGNGTPVFRDFDDLRRVKGIGPKTAQSISRWLEFERE